jgi:hypothetical protein
MNNYFNIIPVEIISIILSNIETIDDRLSVRECCKKFNSEINFKDIKKEHLDNKLWLFKKKFTHRPYKFNNNKWCINIDCKNIHNILEHEKYGRRLIKIRMISMGLISFFYLDNGKYSEIERYIPYCEDCMIENVNLGPEIQDLFV